jgi:hypothetical protein
MTPFRIGSAADIAAIGARPYRDFVDAGSVVDALERGATPAPSATTAG